MAAGGDERNGRVLDGQPARPTFRAGRPGPVDASSTPPYMHANSANGWAAAESWVGYDGTRLASIMFTVADDECQRGQDGSRSTTPLPDRHDRPARCRLPWTALRHSGVGFEER
ncbi:MAG: hypothetical protein MZU79_06980 [Anaerotruncus sp.]|nr:hypothetical protein [Anaerotruncus sp.]